MGGGGWIIIGVLVCVVIIGAVVWLVMRSLKNTHASPLSPQPHPSQMNGQGYESPPKPSTETDQEGGNQYRYPQPMQSPQPQKPPLH